MLKIFNAIVCLFILMIAVNTRAASDNLILTQYKNAGDMPSTFLTLGGGDAMTGKSYLDDEGKSRTDKVYYTTTHSYESSYRAEDIARLLNPSDGKLGSLFDDTTINKSGKAGVYNVAMNISTPIKDFHCESLLTYKNLKSGSKNVFIYNFSNFNMVFTDMVIQVEVETVGSVSKVKLFQVIAMKGSTYSKLKSYFAVGKFEKAMKDNIRSVKAGIGGI